MNVGDFVALVPGHDHGHDRLRRHNEWMGLWTLFFWAWWVAWASFVGLFLARISRGRTIRAVRRRHDGHPVRLHRDVGLDLRQRRDRLERVRGGDEAFAEAAQNYDGRGFFMLLEEYPACRAW